MIKKTTVNFDPIMKMIGDELHGTGLMFGLVVWRPNLPDGPDSAVVLSTSEELADIISYIANDGMDVRDASSRN